MAIVWGCSTRKMRTIKMCKEKAKEYVCDNLCKFTEEALRTYSTQEAREAAMEEYCSHCQLEKMMNWGEEEQV